MSEPAALVCLLKCHFLFTRRVFYSPTGTISEIAPRDPCQTPMPPDEDPGAVIQPHVDRRVHLCQLANEPLEQREMFGYRDLKGLPLSFVSWD